MAVLIGFRSDYLPDLACRIIGRVLLFAVTALSFHVGIALSDCLTLIAEVFS